MHSLLVFRYLIQKKMSSKQCFVRGMRQLPEFECGRMRFFFRPRIDKVTPELILGGGVELTSVVPMRSSVSREQGVKQDRV